MTDYARAERRQLADLLQEVGPDLDTVCAGWSTRDLAAHLVVRERRPDAVIGNLIPPLAGHGEHVRLAKAAQPYSELVHEVRTPPWWSPLSNPLVDPLANTVEFFIHHEDVRRAQPGWTPRELPATVQDRLWAPATFYARRGAGRPGVVLRRTDRPGVEARIGAGGRTVEGEPLELLLWASGRRDVAQVTVG